MNYLSIEFRRTLFGILIFGFIVIGLSYVHYAEAIWKSGDKGKEIAFQQGKIEAYQEAINLGLARYEGTNIIWNTNLHKSLNLAIKHIQRLEDLNQVELEIKLEMMNLEFGMLDEKTD